MSIPDDEKDKKNKKQQGSGRPGTKFMERPKPDPQDSSDIGGEEYWGQGRQQKEKKDRQDPEEN